ncbi:MAG: preprotein translocase subunit SecG [Rhodobacter sp.]|nr:preprotein translocase subunit SecG [Rhodobacter sp.]
MENVVLTIHLILALLLIGVVLLQRSEGGGLGIGGGGGGAMSARGAATALTKLTWIFATAFIITSITLTVLATRGSESGSVVDTLLPAADAPATDAPVAPGLTGNLLPPTAGDAPATAPRADEPAGTAAPATNP